MLAIVVALSAAAEGRPVWLIEAAALAVAAGGLAMNRSWSRWPVYAAAFLTSATWAVVAWRSAEQLARLDPLVAVASVVPGVALVGACAGASWVIRRHFRLARDADPA